VTDEIFKGLALMAIGFELGIFVFWLTRLSVRVAELEAALCKPKLGRSPRWAGGGALAEPPEEIR
jgi:hypothetical protein